MMVESEERLDARSIGRNVQRMRMFLGIKQDTLAAELCISGSEVSKIEKQDEIDEELLSRIASVLGVSPEIIREFDVDRAIYNINNYKDATISEGATTTVYVALQQINPIEKVVELYERLLQSEREKIDLLKNR